MNTYQAKTTYSFLFILGFFSSPVKFAKLAGVKSFALAFIAGMSRAARIRIEMAWQSLEFRFPALNAIRASGAATRGVELVIEIIMIAIGLYVAAFILPGALTAIATTALTSVNAGVQTLFQVLTPLIAVVVLILLLIAVIRHAMS